MLRIELFNAEGKKVVYEQKFVSGRKVREVLKMQSEFERNVELTEVDQLDMMVEYVAGLFDDKDVTTDAILDGIEAPKLMKTLSDIMGQVMGNEEEGLKEVALKAQK